MACTDGQWSKAYLPCNLAREDVHDDVEHASVAIAVGALVKELHELDCSDGHAECNVLLVGV
eukprot:3849523-Pleurochrysis_carterae.AAC.2